MSASRPWTASRCSSTACGVGANPRSGTSASSGTGAKRAAAELVQAAVADEPVQPGGEADGGVVAAQRAVRADQRLLHDVLGELAAAPEDARGVALEALRVALVDELERGLVAVPQAADERRVTDPPRFSSHPGSAA